MSSGTSVTDIAAKISLDYSAYMQGIKVVESRAVDMAKAIATPFYPGQAPDVGAAHVGLQKAQESIINKQLVEEQIAIRNREEMILAGLRKEQQAATENAKQTAKHEEEITERSAALRAAIRERYAKEDAVWMIPMAKANAEKIRKFNEEADEYLKRAEVERRQNWVNNYNKNPAFVPAYSNYEAAISNMRATADAETEIVERSTALREAIQARYESEDNARRAKAIQRDNRAYEEDKRIKQQAVDDHITRKNNEAAIDEAVMEERARAEKEDIALKNRAEQILRGLMTAQDLHNERVKEYTMLLNKGKFSQTQFNAAVKESERVMRTSGKGAGAYTGMLAQASFAAEDFIQGIAMGDLRAALLGASNNLTMVARGAFEAAEGVTILGMGIKTFTAYALAIPAAVGGLVAYTSWLNRAAKDTRDLSTVLRDTARGFELVEQSMSFRQQAGRERQRIDEIEDITQAQRELKKATTDQAEAEERLVKARAKRSREGTDILISTLGGQDAYIELQNLIHDLGESEHQASIALGQAMEQSLAGAFGAAQAGEAEKMINYLREINNLSNSMIMQNAKPGGLFENLNILLNDITAQDSLEAVFNTGFLQQTEDQERLREIREKMLKISLDIAKAENDVKQATTNKADSERRILELKQDQIRLQNEALKEEQRIAEQQRLQRQAEMQGEADMLEEKRKQQVFDLQATENQKEMLRIQQQMREFMGPAGTVQPLAMSSITGPLAAALMMGQMQQEAQAAGVQFLEAQAANLEKEIAALQQSSSPEVIGGMQQDAFQAQADAFKQIFAAENKQPNPQLTRQIQLLADIKAAIAKGAVFQLVGQ